MSFIIERMQLEVRPYAGSLITYLPNLWEESAEHNLLRCAIVTTLTNLVWVSHVCAISTTCTVNILCQKEIRHSPV